MNSIKLKSIVQIWVHSILYLWWGDRGSFAVQSGDHFPSGDHLRFKLRIISGPGIICGSSWGSFAGLYSASFFESAISWDHFLIGHHKEISSFYVMIYKRIAEEHHLRSLLATRKVLIYICSSKFYSLFWTTPYFIATTVFTFPGTQVSCKFSTYWK